MTLSRRSDSWPNRVKRLHAESSIHWKAPAVMILSVSIGILISFVHHVFNVVLDGRSAGNATEQQWVRRVETAFAFASKLFLAISTTVAYTQYMWFHLQRNTCKMSTIDALFAATKDSFRFLHVKLWRKRPILAFIAFVTWTLPLAAIFTPGTLTVQPELHTHIENITVPERHWSDVPFYSTALHINDSSVYKGMSVETTRNVGRVQLANELLAVPRPDTNVTYSTNFAGPAVSCSRMDDADVGIVGSALKNLTESSYVYHAHPFTDSQIVYFGWVPQEEPGLGEVNTTFFENLITQGNSASSANLDYVSTDAARIYVYLNTSGLAPDLDDDGQFKRVADLPPTKDALITCRMYNASYDVLFDVRSTGEQNVGITASFLNWQTTLPEGPYGNSSVSDSISSQALMEAFGWTFTQFLYVLPPSNGSTTIYGTHTLEMNPALLPVQADLQGTDSAEYMMNQMEAFFRNMTLGLRYADLPDHSDNSSLVEVNATSQFFRSDYVYEPAALIIAYAISNIITLICVAIGAYAIYKNNASFTNNFSTIVRVTNHLDLEEFIDEKDRAGADPLPRNMTNTVVALGPSQGERVKTEEMERQGTKDSASWSINEPSAAQFENTQWQRTTLRGMGLR